MKITDDATLTTENHVAYRGPNPPPTDETDPKKIKLTATFTSKAVTLSFRHHNRTYRVDLTPKTAAAIGLTADLHQE